MEITTVDAPLKAKFPTNNKIRTHWLRIGFEEDLEKKSKKKLEVTII